MKILQLGDNDIYGNKFNGHNLTRYLNALESQQVHHVVLTKYSNDQNTSSFFSGFERKEDFHRQLQQLHQIYSSQIMFYPYLYELFFNSHYLNADVVHCHLLHNEVGNLSLLPMLSTLKPLIWTLHDPWALTGHCIHPASCERWRTGCGDCPSLDTHFSLEQDTTALNWEFKRQFYNMSNFHIIVASEWMKKRIVESPLFDNKPVHVIPFGLDLSIFKPLSKGAAKLRLQIPENQFVIGFRSSASEFKGLPLIIKLLENLKKTNILQSITLLTFDKKGLLENVVTDYSLIELGWIADDTAIATAYNACDIFLMPSENEAFGMMALEAMACGTPVVGMQGTAIEELVNVPEYSLCFKKHDINHFTLIVSELINDSEFRSKIRYRQLKNVQSKHNLNVYLEKLVNVYRYAIHSHIPTDHHRYIIAQQNKLLNPMLSLKNLETKVPGKQSLGKQIRSVILSHVQSEYPQFFKITYKYYQKFKSYLF